jgi:hypothetical protein
VSAVKQPVRGLSPDEMAIAEAVGREGEADLEAWRRSSASSALPGVICAMRNPDARYQHGTGLGPGFDSGSSPSHTPQRYRTFPIQLTLAPWLPCTDLSLSDGVVGSHTTYRVCSLESSSGRAESPRRMAIQRSAPRVRTYDRPPDRPASPHNNQHMDGERLRGDRWIQRAKESDTFNQGGVQWIT